MISAGEAAKMIRRGEVIPEYNLFIKILFSLD
jgi:hypothetical protein